MLIVKNINYSVPLVEQSTLANHLFSSKDGITAPLAALSRSGTWSAVGAWIVDGRGGSVGTHQGGAVAETETLGSEKFSVACTAMNFLVGSVAGKRGVQGTVTFGAVEALLVPHLEAKHYRLKTRKLRRSV